MHTRFRDHTLRIFRKHNMEPLAFFSPTDGANTEDTLIYLLGFESREAAEAAWTAFRADPEWQQVKAASEANGTVVEKTESVFLTAAPYSPMS
ncbi:hypothetical protein GCM10009841_20030 [Microlunatus panaciterrae]